MFKEKFPYKEYPRETAKDGTRKYLVNGHALPSVTTILSLTKTAESKKALQSWKNSIGSEEASKIIELSCDIGTQLHNNLENFIRFGDAPAGTLLVKMMTDVMIKRGVSHLDEVWGLETPLFIDKVYAGTADFICVYNEKPTIGDFKNSRSNKSLDQIDDYRCQLAAYSLAHNEMFGTNINQGVIMMVTQDCNYLEFNIEGKMFQDSITMWLTRLEEYYDKFM